MNAFSNFDTGGSGGSEGPWLSWSARGTQDGEIPAKSFFIRDTDGKKKFTGFDTGGFACGLVLFAGFRDGCCFTGGRCRSRARCSGIGRFGLRGELPAISSRNSSISVRSCSGRRRGGGLTFSVFPLIARTKMPRTDSTRMMMPIMSAALATLRPHTIARGSTLMNIVQQVAASIGTALFSVLLTNGIKDITVPPTAPSFLAELGEAYAAVFVVATLRDRQRPDGSTGEETDQGPACHGTADPNPEHHR